MAFGSMPPVMPRCSLFTRHLAVEEGIPILHDRTGKRLILVNGLRQVEAALRNGERYLDKRGS